MCAAVQLLVVLQEPDNSLVEMGDILVEEGDTLVEEWHILFADILAVDTLAVEDYKDCRAEVL